MLKPDAMLPGRADLAATLRSGRSVRDADHHVQSEARGPALDEAEPGRSEECAVLVDGPLPATGYDEHVEVAELRLRDRVRRPEVALDDDERRVVARGRADAAQDRRRLVVVPVVQDRAQDVGVAAVRHAVEEAPG